jgi:hypothetical protein
MKHGLVLFVADAEGRLVWGGPDSFALLRPPMAAPEWRVPVTIGWRMLRWLDQQWGLVMFVLPMVFGLLSAALVNLAGGAVIVSLLLVLLTMLFLCVVMTNNCFARFLPNTPWHRAAPRRTR